MGSIPGSGRAPGGGNRNPLQYSCLGNPMDRRAWRATVHGGLQRVGHDSSNRAATAEGAGSLGGWDGAEGVSPSSAAGGWAGAQPSLPFESSTILFHWRILFLCTGQFPRYSETLYLELGTFLED